MAPDVRWSLAGRKCTATSTIRAAPKREGGPPRGPARASRAGSFRAVKTQLQTLADRVLSGEVDRADAAVCGQLLNVKLRALEQERKWKEVDELEERLEVLEEVLKGRKTR